MTLTEIKKATKHQAEIYQKEEERFECMQEKPYFLWNFERVFNVYIEPIKTINLMLDDKIIASYTPKRFIHISFDYYRIPQYKVVRVSERENYRITTIFKEYISLN